MKNRIKKIIDDRIGTHRGAITQFANSISAGTGLVGNWLNGTSSPGADYRSAICDKYEISRKWLDSGEGPMILPTKTNEASLSISQINEQEYVNKINRLEGELVFANKMIDKLLAEKIQQKELLRTKQSSTPPQGDNNSNPYKDMLIKTDTKETKHGD